MGCYRAGVLLYIAANFCDNLATDQRYGRDSGLIQWGRLRIKEV